MSHGSKIIYAPGPIGAGYYPGRVYPGGWRVVWAARVNDCKLTVVMVDPERTHYCSGAVPVSRSLLEYCARKTVGRS